MAHANTPRGAMVNGATKGDALGAWFRNLLKGWQLPGGKSEPPTSYQLISDAPGQAGKCSSSCCSSKCQSSVGCATDAGDPFIISWAPRAAHGSLVVVMGALLVK